MHRQALPGSALTSPSTNGTLKCVVCFYNLQLVVLYPHVTCSFSKSIRFTLGIFTVLIELLILKPDLRYAYPAFNISLNHPIVQGQTGSSYTVYPSICCPAKPSGTEIDLLENPNNDHYVHLYLSLRDPIMHKNEEEICLFRQQQQQQAVHNGS